MTDQAAIGAATRALLRAIGEDPDRPGLADTPDRVARWWAEFIDYEPGNATTTFDSVQVDQMVAVSGVRVWSLCEHHLLPFWADLTIAYIARDEVVGLSKLARMAHNAAHRLQLQSRWQRGNIGSHASRRGSATLQLSSHTHRCRWLLSS